MVTNNKVELTALQRNYLNSLKVGDIIKGLRLIKKFAKASLLDLHSQTGTQVHVAWAHVYTKCYYIDDCKGFRIDGYGFGEKYVDGSIMPFLALTAKNNTGER
jgi:hypothetical protein